VYFVTSYYPENINKHFISPKNAGRLDRPSASGMDASFVCGCFVRFEMQIDAVDKRIVLALFQTNGCGYMIAAADVLSQQITGRELTELHGAGATETSESIQSVLGNFPDHRSHCLATCISAMHVAFADYRDKVIEEFRGEKALVCTCFGISEETIEKCITKNQPETAADVANLCKAGSGCGSCRMLIQEMIDTKDH
jgi:NifU-like protein